MCGFVGVSDPRGVTEAILREMTASLAHRGPDDSALLLAASEGFVPSAEQSPLGLGFQRLSILDLSEQGRQPMVTPNGRFALVFNGEIYNFRELREELIREGCVFRGGSDTEVLLHLYARRGPAMLERLNGMFALAVHDLESGTLLLARDRLGIKPLYYHQSSGRLLFASEAKAFLYHPDFSPTLDQRRLDEYFLFRYVAGADTMLEGVRSVEPGTYLLWNSGRLTSRRYWEAPEEEGPARGYEAAKAQLEALLRDSVKLQMVSDVKVGSQLSGGVDSSLVSLWAAEAHGELFDSVSIIFDSPRHSEEPYIDRVNRRLKLAGHKARLDPDFILENLDAATWHNDFPLSHPNSIGIFRLSREAKRHVTVLLSGEGADEVFGGYPRYYRAAWIDRLGPLGSMLYPGGRDAGLVSLSAFSDPALIGRVFPGFEARRALEPRLALWSETSGRNPLERLMNYERRTYLVELLLRQDKMCMAHGIENRVPYLDHRVVEFSKRLPTGFKLDLPLLPRRGRAVRHTKRILKDLCRTHFGEDFTYRAKCGFPLPLDELFASEAFAETYADRRRALHELGFLRLPEIDRVYERARSEGGKYSELLWVLVCLASWRNTFRRRPSGAASGAAAGALS